MAANLIYADLESFLGIGSVHFYCFIIGAICNANHLFQRQHHVSLVDLPYTNYNFPILNSSGRFHNDMILVCNRQIRRIEIIYFTRFFKANSYY